MTTELDRQTNVAAWSAFCASARQKPPTRAHRPALWENMLGTLYACNAAGVVRYFDYRYADAIAYVGAVTDVRRARARRGERRGTYMHPRPGQIVWYAIDAK